MYLARRKKHIHIAFDRKLISSENTEESLKPITHEWQKYEDKSTHEVVFPRFIHSIRWNYDYLIFRKKV